MKYSTPALGLLLCCSAPLFAAAPLLAAAPAAATTEQRIASLEQQLAELKQSSLSAAKSTDAKIKIGGAVRFQYSYEDFKELNRERGGDIDFDVFRLDVNGTVGDVSISAQYRWYQYMNVIHHAYIGYKLSEQWQAKLGITLVPFGNLGANSNSFFLSDNFYVGLEDDYDTGLVLEGNIDQHNIHLAFFKNDEQGGLDAYVSDRNNRYSFDVVNQADGKAMAESNTFNARYAYDFGTTQVGASLQYGKLVGEAGSVGDRSAYAVHIKSQFDQLEVMFQYSDYEYDLDNGDQLVKIGAYHYSDNIPASASLYNLNLSYSLDVAAGPVTNLKFYNDFSLMTDKSAGIKQDTVMNVLGFMVSAGNIVTYVDLISAKNQPFVGGAMTSDLNNWNTRLNINVGYYF